MAVKKKWATHMRPAEIAAAAKTTRTVRCVVKDSKVCLRYSHQVHASSIHRTASAAAGITWAWASHYLHYAVYDRVAQHNWCHEVAVMQSRLAGGLSVPACAGCEGAD